MIYTDPAHKELHEKHSGYLELPLLNDLKALPKKPGVAIDIGANVGNHAVFFAREMGMSVFAFEPHPETFKILKGNALGLQIACINKGVDSVPGSLWITNKVNTGQNKISHQRTDMAVELTDLRECELLEVAIIKIDVEGYELRVLQSPVVQSLIDEYKPYLAIECRDPELILKMLPAGYKIHAKHGGAPTYIYVHEYF